MNHFGKTTVRALVLTVIASLALVSSGCYLNTTPSFGEEHPRDYVQAQQNTPRQTLQPATSSR